MTSLVMVRTRGPCAVQDGGRHGHMHEGVPPGGALVPDLLAWANAAVGNAESAAAVECYGATTVVAKGGTVVVATDDGAVRTLADGESMEVSPRPREKVRYIAVAGAIDVPVVLGGRGTLAAAGLGGLGGRWLRAGDVLPVGPRARGNAALVDAVPLASAPIDARSDTRATRAGAGSAPVWSSPVRVILGPDGDRFDAAAGEVLLASEWTISAVSDRTGVRLEGPALPRKTGDTDVAVSSPMVRGALQVPASGAPIALGPDHPTTGGYPVVAVIVSADWSSFAIRGPGEKVRFCT